MTKTAHERGKGKDHGRRQEKEARPIGTPAACTKRSPAPPTATLDPDGTPTRTESKGFTEVKVGRVEGMGRKDAARARGTAQGEGEARQEALLNGRSPGRERRCGSGGASDEGSQPLFDEPPFRPRCAR